MMASAGTAAAGKDAPNLYWVVALAAVLRQR